MRKPTPPASSSLPQFKPSRLCVLFSVSGLRERLPGWDEEDVLAAIRAHRLSPAFDIGLGSRSHFRVVPSAVDYFLKTSGARRRLSGEETFTEILCGCEPHGQPWIAGERVRLILNCGADHVNALVDDGELSVKPGTERRRGPNGSDQIALDSFKDFLKRRLL